MSGTGANSNALSVRARSRLEPPDLFLVECVDDGGWPVAAATCRSESRLELTAACALPLRFHSQAAEKADLQPIADAACRSHITYEPGYYEQQIQSCAVAMLSDAQLYALMDELRRSFQYPPVNGKPGVIIKTPELYGLCLRTVPSLDPMTGEQVLGTPNGPLCFQPCSSC